MVQFLSNTLMPQIDEAIAKFLKSLLEQCATWDSNGHDYRVRQAQDSLFALSKGGDAFYDWPDIGWLYLSWYHPRRSLQMLEMLSTIWNESSGAHLNILDFGCGTGATLWALSYLALARQQNESWIEEGPANITFCGIDASSVMLETARSAWDAWSSSSLFSAIGGKLPKVNWSLDLWESQHSDRTNESPQTLITGSYLFDATDISRQERLAHRLKNIIKDIRPRWLCITAPSAKSELLESMDDILGDIVLRQTSQPAVECPDYTFSGIIDQRRSFAKYFHADNIIGKVEATAREILAFRLYDCTGQSEASSVPSSGAHPYKPRLEKPTASDWTDHQLNALQNKLPLHIAGAAGSGKSQVLVERVAQLIRDNVNRLEGMRETETIQVVTFNRRMNAQLGTWFENRLPESQLTRGAAIFNDNDWHFVPANGNQQYSVKFNTFDKLVRNQLSPQHPSTIPDIESDDQVFTPSAWDALLLEESYQALKSPLDSREFLEEEFRRVFHGLGYHTVKAYLDGVRHGRGRAIRVQGPQRTHLFQCLDFINKHIAKNVDEGGQDSWAHRRLRATQTVPTPRLKYLFVDEGQDLLQMEYRWLYSMLQPEYGDHVFVCSDNVQAIHVGSSTKVPNISRGRHFTKIGLESALRLPYRISQFLHPAAESIRDRHGKTEGHTEAPGSPLEASKEAVPGVRPVIIYGETDEETTKHIKSVLSLFSRTSGRTNRDGALWCFDIGKADLESRFAELAGSNWVATNHKVVVSKGMEAPQVLWVTDSSAEEVGNNEQAEAAYTAMTRATYLLIILITDNTLKASWDLLRECDKTAAMFWTEHAEQVFEQHTSPSQTP